MCLINSSNASLNSGTPHTVGIENTCYYLSFVLLVLLKNSTGNCDDFLIEVLDGEGTTLYCISSHHETRRLSREHLLSYAQEKRETEQTQEEIVKRIGKY